MVDAVLIVRVPSTIGLESEDERDGESEITENNEEKPEDPEQDVLELQLTTGVQTDDATYFTQEDINNVYRQVQDALSQCLTKTELQDTIDKQKQSFDVKFDAMLAEKQALIGGLEKRLNATAALVQWPVVWVSDGRGGRSKGQLGGWCRGAHKFEAMVDGKFKLLRVRPEYLAPVEVVPSAGVREDDDQDDPRTEENG